MGEKGEVEVTKEGVVVLHGEKLRTLAKLMYYQEVNRIKSIPFQSEYERGHFLRVSRDAYDKAVSLTQVAFDLLEATKKGQGVVIPKTESEFESKPKSESKPEPVAPTPVELVRKYLEYVELALGLGFTIIKNLELRLSYLCKVIVHAEDLRKEMEGLQGLEPAQAEEAAAKLVQKLVDFKKTTFQAMLNKADPSSRFLSKAIKQSPKDVPSLVNRHKGKLVTEKGAEYDKPIEELTPEQRLEVYDEVLKSSGRGTSAFRKTAYNGLRKAGQGMLLFTVALSAYDIATAENKPLTAVKEGLEFTAGYYGGAAGEAVEAAVVAAIIPAEVIEASALVAGVLSGGTLLVGIAAGCLAAWMVGEVFDKFTHSGGKHAGGVIGSASGTEPRLYPSISKIHVYEAPMPDGAALARRLAYSGPS